MFLRQLEGASDVTKQLRDTTVDFYWLDWMTISKSITLHLRWTPPVIVTIRDSKAYVGFYYIAIIPLSQGGGSS